LSQKRLYSRPLHQFPPSFFFKQRHIFSPPQDRPLTYLTLPKCVDHKPSESDVFGFFPPFICPLVLQSFLKCLRLETVTASFESRIVYNEFPLNIFAVASHNCPRICPKTGISIALQIHPPTFGLHPGFDPFFLKSVNFRSTSCHCVSLSRMAIQGLSHLCFFGEFFSPPPLARVWPFNSPFTFKFVTSSNQNSADFLCSLGYWFFCPAYLSNVFLLPPDRCLLCCFLCEPGTVSRVFPQFL